MKLFFRSPRGLEAVLPKSSVAGYSGYDIASTGQNMRKNGCISAFFPAKTGVFVYLFVTLSGCSSCTYGGWGGEGADFDRTFPRYSPLAEVICLPACWLSPPSL
jgi:hypothetical protein